MATFFAPFCPRPSVDASSPANQSRSDFPTSFRSGHSFSSIRGSRSPCSSHTFPNLWSFFFDFPGASAPQGTLRRSGHRVASHLLCTMLDLLFMLTDLSSKCPSRTNSSSVSRRGAIFFSQLRSIPPRPSKAFLPNFLPYVLPSRPFFHLTFLPLLCFTRLLYTTSISQFNGFGRDRAPPFFVPHTRPPDYPLQINAIRFLKTPRPCVSHTFRITPPGAP